MFRVKNMTVEDLQFAVSITDTMDWNMVNEDFECMIRLEPEGCFVLLSNSERIGIATAVGFGEVGWFGSLIVSEDHRKKGAGSLLVRHAVNYLKKKNVRTVGLYAYIDKVPFYRRLGFEYDSEFIVLKGKGFPSPVGANPRETIKEDIQEVIEFDHSCFGASRGKLLEYVLLKPENLCYMSAEDRQISGYVVAKVYEDMAELGPLVCRKERSAVAVDLLKFILNKLDGFEVSMCVPKRESTILDFLAKSGFSENFGVARMFFGPPVVKDCIYIAESLERG